MAVAYVAVAMAWLVVFPAPTAGARQKISSVGQDLAAEEQRRSACSEMKKPEGRKLCPKVVQTLASQGLTATPKPDAGGGINLGMFTIGEGAMIAKLTNSKADFDHYSRVTNANGGIAQDLTLAWPKQVVGIEPGYYVFVLPKAPGKDLGSRIASALYGPSSTLDGTFMHAVGRAAGKVYQGYCGGCGDSTGCHGDFQTSNAFITEQNVVTLIDLDNLGSKQIPEHDIVHMEASIQILKKAYMPRAGNNKESWTRFFKQMSNSLLCGWEDVCAAGVPGRGDLRCKGLPSQQAGATGRAPGIQPIAGQRAPAPTQGAAPAADHGRVPAQGVDQGWCGNYRSDPSFCSHMCKTQDAVKQFCSQACAEQCRP